MKALKLIWLSDRLHLRNYSRPIINDTYFALNYGPVASHTKDLIEDTRFLSNNEKEYRNTYLVSTDDYNFTSKSDFDKTVFSDTDLAIMEKIYQNFGNFDEFRLSAESHKYPEWKKFEDRLDSKMSSRFVMDYEDFFLNIEEENIFKSDQEKLDLSKELFLENGYIYRPI